ncbi:hypothetical protein GQ43DRAFT_470203 [Delitschia confertaspora ATCC 74209]|uniref:Calcium channel YVC1-like C-terminal transmembrane domain-containing protein n=1 Tax=Delitschia confertaspora ATCC 74209 TaxID=1513339 RepID=A0A9P4JPI9_9PLEO|nr:hypothetical protein GQ43DRAFT_470203 [Delitschia confertaspora ATCC 74209]
MSSLLQTPKLPIDQPDIPPIADDDDFGDLVKKLSFYFNDAVDSSHSFEDFRSSPSGWALRPLIMYLSDEVHHPAIVSALLALKSHFSALEETNDEPGVNETRGYACEFVAWQFVTNLSEREAIDYLLYELPPDQSPSNSELDAEQSTSSSREATAALGITATTPLLSSRYPRYSQESSYFGTDSADAVASRAIEESDDITSQFVNLSALEIASISGSKKFLSQRAVQKIINGIWRGDIVLWETLGVHSVKCPKLYNRKRADPFCRLRVPRYLKVFETLFFAAFLALYFVVLVQRNFDHITPAEILLFIWIAGYAYEELGEIYDAEQTSFYTADFWWLWDMSIVIVGTIFFIMRIVGLTTSSRATIDMSYDVLGLEALFLVPRTCSLLSLNPYFGTLMPCLREMTKDFIKFLSLVVILYLGFLTTFTLLARDQFTPREMSWILVKVFFGSSYLGFDTAKQISPYFGPPVMLVFVALTNILLITSLISLLSNSLSKNLIPLLLRPARLVFSSDKVRNARIILLKATHAPFVGAIWLYEVLRTRNQKGSAASISGPETPVVRKRAFMKTSLTSPRPLTGFQGSLDGSANTPGRSAASMRVQTTSSSESDAQLKSLILKLTVQVEQLTGVVAQLQAQGQHGRGGNEAGETG